MMSIDYIKNQKQTYQEEIENLKEKIEYYRNKNKRLQKQLEASEQKRLKGIEFLKGCMNEDNAYMLDQFQVSKAIEKLGDDE